MTFATVRTRSLTTLLAIAVVMLNGCAGDSQPRRDYDPQGIAAALLASFDSNDDGKLGEDELVECLPLQSAIERIDTNQDGAVDAAEISDRIGAYAVMSKFIVAEVYVKRVRTPIADAAVTLTLAEFMGSIPTQFKTTTNASGSGFPQSSTGKLLGFPPGFYDVEVVHGGKTWKFGVEMADDNPSVSRLVFDLKDM